MSFQECKGLHHSMLLQSISAHHTSRQLISLVGLPLWLKVSEEEQKKTLTLLAAFIAKKDAI